VTRAAKRKYLTRKINYSIFMQSYVIDRLAKQPIYCPIFFDRGNTSFGSPLRPSQPDERMQIITILSNNRNVNIWFYVREERWVCFTWFYFWIPWEKLLSTCWQKKKYPSVLSPTWWAEANSEGDRSRKPLKCWK